MEDDWTNIIDRDGRMVYRTAWRILGHVADTEDVVQEVFFEAFRAFTGKPVKHWSALLRRLATCRALDRLRRRVHFAPVDDMAVARSGDEPLAVAIRNELAERLRQAVAQLPNREAEVFCMRYFDGLTNHQITEALGIQAGAVAAALHKAKAKLETMLAEAPTKE